MSRIIVLGLVLGITLGISGIYFYTWQFWLITLPVSFVALGGQDA